MNTIDITIKVPKKNEFIINFSDEVCLDSVYDFQKNFNEKVNDSKSVKMMNITFALLFISIITWVGAYVYIKDLDPTFNWLYILSFISVFVTGFFSIIMDRKTEYGEMIIAKIKGFRNYLNVAEKDQLEMLESKNANYFYDILPYAYILGVSNTWIEKFSKKNISNIDLSALNSYQDDLFMIIN